MTIVRLTAEEARRKGRVSRRRLSATTEADIARYAAEDDSATDAAELAARLSSGRTRRVYPLDVAAIRAKTGLSQARFARAFQISAHTLRNWEQRRRVPEGPARALLLAIERDPKALMRALHA